MIVIVSEETSFRNTGTCILCFRRKCVDICSINFALYLYFRFPQFSVVTESTDQPARVNGWKCSQQIKESESGGMKPVLCCIYESKI